MKSMLKTSPNRSQKRSRSLFSRFMTNSWRAMTVSLIWRRRARIRPSPQFRFSELIFYCVPFAHVLPFQFLFPCVYVLWRSGIKSIGWTPQTENVWILGARPCTFLLSGSFKQRLVVHELKLCRRFISNQRMNTYAVIPKLDVLPDVSFRSFTSFIRLQVYQFALNNTVEGLDARVSGPEESHPEALSEPDSCNLRAPV